jgi:hypothetical protein
MRVYVGPGCGPGCGCGCFLAPLVLMGYLAFWAGVMAIVVLVIAGTFLYVLARELFRAGRNAWNRRRVKKARSNQGPPEPQAKYSDRR